MSRSTSVLRQLWAPPCEGPFARVELHGGGQVTVDPLIVPAVLALNACLVAHSYEATPPDVGAYNCRRITGGTGWSLHAYGIALDINWLANPYGRSLVTDMPMAMIEAIEAIRTNSGAVVWRWGGRYQGNKDAMHFEIVASPAEIATGVAGSVQEPSPPPSSGGLVRVEAMLPQLQEGSTGMQVAMLQSVHNVKNGLPYGGREALVADGDFGGKTKAEVVLFQQYKGLAADGVVGPKTWTAELEHTE